MKPICLSLFAILLAGCTDKGNDTAVVDSDDLDADGYTAADGDCDDGDEHVYPGAAEVWYDGIDQDCDGNDTDQDQDGFAVGDDCDDTNLSVNPDEQEVCDGLDNDCDGVVDLGAEDGQIAYIDNDGDGHGSAGNQIVYCDEIPDGYAASADDCDDTQATAYPGAEEICDDLDNDCDGDINEDDPDEVPYYRDADADGYGDAADSVLSCATPEGYVADSTDCDDAIAVVNPGADEYCDDTDRNCDGDPYDNPVDGYGYYTDGDGDGYGDPATELRSCDVLEGLVEDGTDCDDAEAATNPGAIEICNGADDDCSGVADDGLDYSDWYADADGDTYGDPATALSACAEPDGYVADATDCDDTDELTFPGAEEFCDLEDNNCDGTVDDGAVDERVYYDDADSDGYGNASVTTTACGLPSGYSETDDDCDDANSSINPGASESCNGLDDDCDGTVDEEAVDGTAYYADGDGDGYGDLAVTQTSCDAPSGYVTDTTDCDDATAAINPAATELCDGADNNCDGVVDETDAADALTWYEDGDGDGFGTEADTQPACTQPAGYAAEATDCDDADAAVNPAAAETCDGADDNCDGVVDESGALGETTWYADVDADGYGSADATLDACDQPAGYEADADDCDDGDASSYPGASELDDLADNDCDGWVDEDFVLDGDVIITEITRQPRLGGTSTNTLGQWFEVYNTSSRDVDLSNWYVRRSNTVVGADAWYVDPAAAVIVGAGDYAVFCNRDDYASVSTSASTLVCDHYWADETASSTYTSTYADNTFNLQRDDDALQLWIGGDDSTGVLVDEVHWTYSAADGYWPRDAARSLSLDPAALDGVDNDDVANWCSTTNSASYRWYYVSASNAEYGTPGAANYDCP